MMNRFCRTGLTLCMAFILGACAQQKGSAPNTSTIQQSSRLSPDSTSRGAGCAQVGGLDARYDRQVAMEAFDEALFDSAVLHFTNQRRCAAGLAPLSPDTGLRRSASTHSSDMARMGFFSHTSPVPGRAKLTDRLNESGVRYRAAAENLATRSRLQLVSGKQFTVLDRSSCAFAYGGQQIQPHSYRTLAQQFVEVWESSPQHRENMMNTAYTRMGAGGRFQPNERNCGDIVATQNFAA